MKLLEERVLFYYMIARFIIPDFIDEYVPILEYLWVYHASAGFNLLITGPIYTFNRQSCFKRISMIIVLMMTSAMQGKP